MRIDFGSTKQRSALRKAPAQIMLALSALVIQCAALLIISSQASAKIDLIYTTTIGCGLATIVGIFLVRNVGQYPGVEESAYIVPGFCLSYGALLLVFVLGRFEYSRILLISTFLINVFLFLVLYSALRRSMKLRIGLVAEGDYTALLNVKLIHWTVLSSPDACVDRLDAISVDLRSNLSDDWERRLAQYALLGLPVYHSKHLLESLSGKVEIEHLSENSFGTLTPLSAYMSVKQIVDVIAAIIALAALAPFFLLLAIWIRLDSTGPALFRQMRMGYQGRPFWVYKFRTMTAAPVEIDAREAAKTKAGDQRITRIGGFLRKSRIDELPQLFNVIRGEMSWIGPRPEAEVLSLWYETEIPFYQYRHIVRPGITGWAQVNQGHVAEVSDVTEKLHYDFYYIKNFSPWIDLLIVVRTIRTMMTGFGAR